MRQSVTLPTLPVNAAAVGVDDTDAAGALFRDSSNIAPAPIKINGAITAAMIMMILLFDDCEDFDAGVASGFEAGAVCGAGVTRDGAAAGFGDAALLCFFFFFAMPVTSSPDGTWGRHSTATP